ncbi:MAG: hypothetical protein K9W43_14250 [Candidatus Thorarchaeota archaeon]|nr:hypothetical protein [Candidatus Thorarchaeota archaeon]
MIKTEHNKIMTLNNNSTTTYDNHPNHFSTIVIAAIANTAKYATVRRLVCKLKSEHIHITSMANIIISIPDDIRERMREYPEIKWSKIVRRAIFDYLDTRMGSETYDSAYYAKLAKQIDVDLDEISIEAAEKHYKKMRELDWKRHSTTQMSS